MPMRFRVSLVSLLILAAYAPEGVKAQSAMPAAAANAERDFDIQAGSLDDALSRFGARAGIMVLADTRLTAGRNSPGVRGRYSVDVALVRLLSGTGLQAYRAADGGYRLRLAPSPDGSGVSELEAVEVLGNDPKPADEVYRTAASVNYLSQDDIERFRGTSVGDIFQGIPGVLVGENRNSGGLDINIRGMQGQGRVPVLVDGARQETTVYRGYSGVASRSYVDPDLIGGIEISKGPVAGALGTGATGGVVAMRTINAKDIIKKEDENWGIRVRGSTSGNSSAAPAAGTAGGMFNAGTYRVNCDPAALCGGQYSMPDTYRNDENFDRPGTLDPYSYASSVAGAWRNEKLELVAAVSKRRQGTYFAGKHGKGAEPVITLTDPPPSIYYDTATVTNGGTTRFYTGERVLNSNNESNSQLLKGKLKLSDAQDIELSYLRYHSEYGELMPSQLMWFNKIYQTQNSEVTAQTATLSHHWQPADQSWLDLRTKVWMTHTDSLNRNYASEDQAEAGAESGVAPEPETYRRIGVELGNTSQFEVWGEHTLSYGATFQHEKISTDPSIGALDDAAGREGNRREYSLYMDWHWQPAPEWQINYGLRYQNSRTRDGKLSTDMRYECGKWAMDAQGVESCQQYVAVPTEMCDGVACSYHYKTRNSGTVPVYSISWEPWLNGLQFYARHAEALRMPSLFESTQGWSVQPAPGVPLRPEHTRNREFGLNLLTNDVLRSNDRLAFKAAYFRNKTNDYLTRTSPNEWENLQQDFVMRNIRSVKLRGFEATLDYDAGRVYTRLSGTRYNFIEVCHEGSYRRDDCNNYGVAASYFNDMIPPKWHASVLLGTRWLDGKLDLGARLTLMGKRNPTPAFNDDTKRAFNWPTLWQDYKVVDIYARYQYSEAVSVDFNIDNLTDRYYVDPLSLGMVPAPGRTARLGLTLNF
ncbi:TonB-dependent receptor [Kerstersia gyiorum]|nr:TonB-dependent receptor [Kerstersia gyiorum]